MSDMDALIINLDAVARCLDKVGSPAMAGIVRDTIALLREQEPVKPYAEGDGSSFACDNCGENVGWEEMNCGGISMVKYKFCPECGRKVMWDE